MSETSASAIASDYLEANSEAIVENWIAWVRERVRTDTIEALPERALRNHIPPVLISLARYLRHPVELARGDLLNNLRLHGEIRRDQGYSMAEVLAEFDGLADVVTRAVTEAVAESEAVDSVEEILDVARRLATGLRSISFIAMGTFAQSDEQRAHQISQNLEHLARAITHEMRNPLNSISLGVEVLRTSDVDDSVVNQLDVMDASVRRCRYLLDTMLVLTLAENARSGDRMVKLDDAVRRILKEFAASATALDVGIRVDKELPDVRVEALLLYIVLANLVSNSVKYRDMEKPERWVSISARYLEEKYDSGFCELTVEDNGVGIAEEFVARVCQRGFRAHAEIAEGTGIGLYLVQQTVTARGGDVRVESTEGAGTKVTTTMRCLHADADALTADQFRVEHLMGDVVLREMISQPDIPEKKRAQAD